MTFSNPYSCSGVRGRKELHPKQPNRQELLCMRELTLIIYLMDIVGAKHLCHHLRSNWTSLPDTPIPSSVGTGCIFLLFFFFRWKLGGRWNSFFP